MLEISDGYRSAIVGDVRRMLIKAVIDISDPDMVLGTVSSSGATPWSKPEQLHDKVFELDSRKAATLEHNRWLLDGSFGVLPDDPSNLTGETSHVGDVLSGEDGSFASPVWVELPFSNVAILQACSVYFSQDVLDGTAEDFSVAVYSGDTAVYTKNFTGNTETSVSMDGFTVYDPTAIRVTVTKWSLPFRRMRVAEIIPGVYEHWTSDIIASLDIQMRGNFACLAIPYGTCTLRMDNLDRRFEPRNKNGVFRSIEERQAIPVAIGCELADGSVDYKQVGVFFQANGGWKTGDNGITMQWDLVDIVGLLAAREFKAPSTIPTTLSGWIAALVGQLGSNFTGWYHVDPDYADAAATVNAASDVEGQKCGDILRWVCMATGTWPRADAETGYLTAEPFWSQGNKLDLDNMTTYPVMKANDDLAVLTFKLFDSSNTVLNISGNATSSSNTLTVSNPFLHTAEQAQTAARQILSQYGGIKLDTVSRGDPAGEIGDVDTVWLNESSATTGRRMEQRLAFSNGVLRDCKSVLLQADGSFLFSQRAVITQSGRWTAPAGVDKLRYIIVGPGFDGQSGTDGTWDEAGEDGADGAGGLVLAGTISINNGQVFQVSISDTETTFGALSSASGASYPYGFTDVASGNSYGRTGVPKPLAGSGDGGAGGRGGEKGHYRTVIKQNADGTTTTKTVVDNRPGQGRPGAAGATGCVVLYWDVD